MSIIESQGSAARERQPRPISAPQHLVDRRRSAAGPRLSWASSQPFVSDDAEPPRRTLSDTQNWHSASVGYVRRAVALDLLIAGVVVPLVLALVGRTEATAVQWGFGTAAGFLALVAAMRGYESRLLGDGPDEFRALLRATVGVVAAVALVSVALGAEMPRRVVVLTIVLLMGTTVVGRYALRKNLHRRRTRGEAMARTLVVGDAASVHRVITDLRAATYHGYRVVGVCLPSITDLPPQDGVPTLGALADIPQVAYDEQIDVVIVTGGELAGDALRRLSWALGHAGTDLVVAPGLVEVLGPRVQLRPAAGLTLLEVETNAPRTRLMTKSVIDRTVAAMMLLLALPVLLGAVVAVRATSRGKPFYQQRRIGIDGREFTMWKLRSMYVDADARRSALLASSDRDGLMFKMRDDPRVTPVGKFLRRYSIDELPQLWNVLRGDMSLVGPRPPLPEEVDAYRDAVNRRLHVRPGLTGLWQVSGRSDLSWDESVRLDLRYVDNWSVTMDLLILWKTGRAVFGASGAY